MRPAIPVLAALFSFAPLVQAGPGAAIQDQAELELLLGKHPFALQWISWQKFGRVEIKRDNDDITLKGAQEDQKTGNYIRIEGVVTGVARRSFEFTGTINYRVDHLNGGKPCIREGKMTFKRRGKRKYWRLTNMNNPCDEVTDYIDVFLPRVNEKKQ